MISTEAFLKSLIKNPSTITTKSQAKQLHAQIIKSKSPISNSLSSSILSIFSSFTLLPESIIIFNTLSSPPFLAFKSLIKSYTSHGLFSQSLSCFVRMRAFGIYPDINVFPIVVKACAALMDSKLGESIHGCIISHGVDFDLYTCNALMNLYSKLQTVNVNIVKAGYVFETIDESRQRTHGVHIESVRKLFETMPRRDIVSWNTVIAGCARNGMYKEALMSVRDMGRVNLKPDCFTMSSVLPMFSDYVDVLKGKEIHGFAIRHGFDEDLFIGSGLIDMYAKCTRIEDSRRVFYHLPLQDSISWNSLVAGCVQNGMFDEGLRLFRQMLEAGIKPGHVSFSTIMPACAHLTTLHLGKQLHGYIIRQAFDDNVFIASSLVDMYAKCGKVGIARWIFDHMEVHDMVSWTAIIMAYALHGHAHDAIFLFKRMEMEGVKPNAGSFVAVLTACSHAGLVDEAWHYFNSMVHDCSIAPELEHCAAVADLLGRAGRLQEAYDFISEMPVKPTGGVWSTLLGACRVHKNIDFAEKVAENIFRIDPENRGAYVLLSNIYSAAGRWKDAAKLRSRMGDKGMRQSPACSWIEVKNETHAFVSGDKSHPYYNKIYEALKVLLEQMEHEGYIPDTTEGLHDHSWLKNTYSIESPGVSRLPCCYNIHIEDCAKRDCTLSYHGMAMRFLSPTFEGDTYCESGNNQLYLIVGHHFKD
ncbi:E+ motif, partial [Dillenia turbinata]